MDNVDKMIITESLTKYIEYLKDGYDPEHPNAKERIKLIKKAEILKLKTEIEEL